MSRSSLVPSVFLLFTFALIAWPGSGCGGDDSGGSDGDETTASTDDTTTDTSTESETDAEAEADADADDDEGEDDTGGQTGIPGYCNKAAFCGSQGAEFVQQCTMTLEMVKQTLMPACRPLYDALHTCASKQSCEGSAFATALTEPDGPCGAEYTALQDCNAGG